MYLLDTHVLLWYTGSSDSLGINARALIQDTLVESSLFASAITFWEIAMLVEKGRLTLDVTPEIFRQQSIANGLNEIPLAGDIAIRAVQLRELHRDTADRLIVATALGGYKLITSDQRLLSWTGPLACINASV